MTLHTRIYVEAPYPRKDGFDAALAAICEAAGKPVPSVQTHEGSWGDLAWHMTNRGQGLPGVVICHYRHDAPLAIDDEHDEHGDLIQPRCSIELGWDTGYAYQDEHGGCGALHQRALTALRRIIPAHIPLSWTDEFTGETHALRPR